jgi:bifunctional non-homologous end joining protein LigD
MARAKTDADRLAEYRAKRVAERTPEPAAASLPAPAADRPRVFVVQLHDARRLHYDLRLEMGGVLVSWAVPKGPSYDTAQKQLAVQTEDHPLEYADFEGVIPDGNYGAGPMIVWDRGQWVPHGDPAEGLEKGKLLFELRGYKLRGRWTLVKLKKEPRSWLLIKERDAWARQDPEPQPAGSVLSGLTVEELGEGNARAAGVRAELERLGAPRRRVSPGEVKLELAQTAEKPFSRKGWIFELKYDGFRLLAAKRAAPDAGQPPSVLLYRSGLDASRVYPDIARAVAALPYGSLVLDGEVAVGDENGRPTFQLLQRRAQLARAADIERAALELPATYFAFDLLALEEFDLRPLPLLERKALLARVLPQVGPLRYADHVEEAGEALYAEVRRRGLEGLIAKKADAPYRAGRTAEWLKLRSDREEDFVVVGYTLPKGSRAGLGALHLGAYDDAGRLVYAGRAGSGFTDPQLRAVAAELAATRVAEPPCAGAVPKGKDHVWVRPERVATVRYSESTDAGQLRQPVFVRLRDDKPPEECRLPAAQRPRPGPPAAPGPSAAPRPARSSATAAPRAPKLSNLGKVFWPEDGYTKGDLIAYYRAISPWLLPYLRDRPLVLTRYPDGIGGKNFFQKNAAEATPGWVRTVPIWSEDSQREIDYFVVDDEATLAYVANLGAIPLHVWSSRVSRPQLPDWSIVDLDPKGAPFGDVVTVALALRELCTEIGLEPFIKTSGSSGLHVLLPLGGRYTFDQSRQLAELLARLVSRQLPRISTVERVISARGGRVYLDYLQNGHGKLLVAPFSVRPLPGAPVSTPLEWREVTAGLEPRAFTMKTVPERMSELGRDPLRPLLETGADLARVLARLGARL